MTTIPTFKIIPRDVFSNLVSRIIGIRIRRSLLWKSQVKKIALVQCWKNLDNLWSLVIIIKFCELGILFRKIGNSTTNFDFKIFLEKEIGICDHRRSWLIRVFFSQVLYKYSKRFLTVKNLYNLWSVRTVIIVNWNIGIFDVDLISLETVPNC